MALLEVRARFINRLGFANGNQRILQFVTDGMKLDPINPTLLQGRDSIIAAANARRRHGGRYCRHSCGLRGARNGRHCSGRESFYGEVAGKLRHYRTS